MSHTKGPWAAQPEFNLPRSCEAWVSARDSGEVICLMRGKEDVAKANAILISVAPELLDALETLLGCVEELDTENNSWTEQQELGAAEIKAAKVLIKARGGL